MRTEQRSIYYRLVIVKTLLDLYIYLFLIGFEGDYKFCNETHNPLVTGVY